MKIQFFWESHIPHCLIRNISAILRNSQSETLLVIFIWHSLLNLQQCSSHYFQSPKTYVSEFVSSHKRCLIFRFPLPKRSCSGCQSCLLTGLQTTGELRPQYNPYPPWDSTQMGPYFVTPPWTLCPPICHLSFRLGQGI